jgi:hypothetical protein
MPVNSYYGYSYSQTYYLASEIGTGGLISSIAYYWDGATSNPASNQWTVYMKNSANNQFVDNTAWESGMEQVFSGTVNCPANPGWVTILLSTPFMFDGTST